MTTQETPTATTPGPKTMLDRIFDEHVVVQEPGKPAVLYVDLHLVHEVTSPQAFEGLRTRGIGMRRPDRTVATMDHSTPTKKLAVVDERGQAQLQKLADNCAEFGVPLHALGSPDQGIVHVIGPELGLTQPGMTIVCGDSHTSTHGAFGALAFGIGTSEVEHVLATQCLLSRKPKSMEIRVDGGLRRGVSAKDIVLAVIARIGTAGATGHVLEFTGEVIRRLDMEARMTICNMAIEAGARAGMIAPDDVTFQYLARRDGAPKDQAWDEALARWRALPSDPDAHFDKRLVIDASTLEPMITYGTNPGMGIAIRDVVPDPTTLQTSAERQALSRALEYMALEPGRPILGKKVDVVFIGSCTNSRITDLRQAARVLSGRRVAENMRVLVVPGSMRVKKQAEAEGLDRIFVDAGAEWREPGCSMCIAMNGDELRPDQYAVSTSNRNFEGRQGKGGRTFLASPLTAAAAAVTGRITDPRELL
jgi:3-isopropylmalate/(R)-2-methylmalate dehydratase large subunit